jgi:hypothetical protein
MCQLTGETDFETRKPAFNTTGTQYHLYGTDLGSSFEHNGRLWFLFGDTWPVPAKGNPRPDGDGDSIAWTINAIPEPGIHLQFVNDAGRYRSPKLIAADGGTISTAGFEVPVAGFSTGPQMYIIYTTHCYDENGVEGGLDLFWLAPNGSVHSTWANPAVDSGKWRPTLPIAPAQAAHVPSGLASVSRLPGLADVFWIGPDGGVGTNFANPTVDNGDWHTPFPIAPPRAARADSPVAAVTRFNGAVDVFWIGPDGAVVTTWFNPALDSGHWHTPFPITPPGAARANSPLAAVTRLNGLLDVYWIGPDGAIATNFANPTLQNGVWQRPFAISPPNAAGPNSPIAAVTRFSGAVDVFWIGPDGAVATTWFNPALDSGHWHTPFPITPRAAARANSPLAATTRLSGLLDVFWVGPDGAIGTTFANPTLQNGRWQTPFAIAPPGAAGPSSTIAAVVRFEGAVDVFWLGPDGAAATTWFNPAIDNGRWHTPFPIAPPGDAAPSSSLTVITRHNGIPGKTLMGRSILSIARNNEPTDLHALWDFSVLADGGKFLNVALVVRPNGVPGLPFTGPALLAFGSGRYRQSNVCLAAAPLASAAQQSSWHFYSGANPPWSSDQRAALDLFQQPQVGELSAAFVSQLGVWLLLYNAGTPRGINARVAQFPWGPWSEPVIVFDPALGYGKFMHVKGANDGLSDPGREQDSGGEYGPYLIDRFTKAVPSTDPNTLRAQIYFVLSTWNPYNTVLMTATLQLEANSTGARPASTHLKDRMQLEADLAGAHPALSHLKDQVQIKK